MSLPSPSPGKLRPTHLARQALIYVRQSSLAQVRSHTASAARQYDLAQRARDLGWSAAQIVVIDQDQGQSGASAAGRDGFQRLVAAVGLGQAGAVLSLEASRLARASSDWYRLLKLCILTDTLVSVSCSASSATAGSAPSTRSPSSRASASQPPRSTSPSSSAAASSAPGARARRSTTGPTAPASSPRSGTSPTSSPAAAPTTSVDRAVRLDDVARMEHPG